MKKTNRKAPDRIILFEIGIILALLAVNYVLEMGYNSSFVIPPEKKDLFFDTAYAYREPVEKLIIEPETQPEVKQIEAIFFDPSAAIKFVKQLFEVPELKMAPATNAIPKPISFLPTVPTIDTSIIMDDIADVMPEFPGGDEALGNYIRDHYIITDQMYEYAKEVNLVLEFVVDRNGNISDIQVLKCSLPGLGAEQAAIKMYKSMPKWTPAEHRGKPANIRLKQPIKIQIY